MTDDPGEEPRVELCDCGQEWGDGHSCYYTHQNYWQNNYKGQDEE